MTDNNSSHEKANMKEIAAMALRFLAKDNSSICRSIVESRAFLCFAVLFETAPMFLQYSCAMALAEITTIVEKDADLRESTFNSNSPSCKAIVDPMIKIIEKADSRPLVPCIITIGNLSRTFKAATNTRIIGPLVKLVDRKEVGIVGQALLALIKYACTENELHIEHSKAIISAGVIESLFQHAGFGAWTVRIPALILLSYIALHVPHSKELAQANVLALLERACMQSSIIEDEVVNELLQESKSRLELYQCLKDSMTMNHRGMPRLIRIY